MLGRKDLYMTINVCNCGSIFKDTQTVNESDSFDPRLNGEKLN